MVNLIFEAHATTIDNQEKRASGWNDVPLSELGEQQARELGLRYRSAKLAAVFCSDLQRSYKTASLAFGDTVRIITDKRLRECNYGELNGAPKTKVEAQKPERLDLPYPSGESYRQTAARMRDFLRDLATSYDHQTVLIIGHRATQYGLEHWLRAVPLSETISAPWQWQPGWEYQLDGLA